MSRSAIRTVVALCTLAVLVCFGGWSILRGSISLPEVSARPRSVGTIDARFSDAVEDSRQLFDTVARTYPGLSISVAVDGTEVWSEATGYADLAHTTAATPDTVFRVYSVSKPITAAMVLRMVERNQLHLNDTVGDIGLRVPAELRGITLEQLLSHTSGIRHYREGEWLSLSRRHCRRTEEALPEFVNDPLETEPGTRYHYSTFGFVLLSAVLEHVARKDFDEFADTELFVPAGMSSSAFASGKPLATSYEPSSFGRVKPARVFDNSCKFGAGALVSSSRDLTRFGAALLSSTIITRKTLDTMLAPSTTDSSGRQQALGWTIGQEGAVVYLFQSGGAIGGRGVLLMIPSRNIIVSLAGNIEGVSLVDTAKKVALRFAASPK